MGLKLPPSSLVHLLSFKITMALPMRSGMKTAMKTAMQAAKAMKTTMKGAKAMRVMKKKVVSKIARGKRAKAVVFRGSKEKTSGGLTKSLLFKNKGGKIVSKKASQSSAKRYRNSKIAAWGNAVKRDQGQRCGWFPVGHQGGLPVR